VSELAERLRQRIRAEGPLRFDRFHEAALYDPDGGYYERPGRVGREGDFVTGASWDPAFGRCVARAARRLRDEWGGEEPVDVVDVGAGEGELLAAADEALRGWGIREPFRLIGVERSAVRRERARRACPGVTWLSSVEELPPLRGLVVAYELFDALPVRALVFDGEDLRERVVALDPGGNFGWAGAPCPDGEAIRDALRRRGVALRRNQKLEIRPGAAELARALARRLSAGLLLVFDYGAPARALYGPVRTEGTLEAFRAHDVSRDVLADPGSRDLTAWVDFTEIGEAFSEAGLEVRPVASQACFLAAAGLAHELARDPVAPESPERFVERNRLAKLLAPGGMGELIRVLAASRGTALGAALTSWPDSPMIQSNH
jgi:SAM-dependent MidA family methyltransferase